MNACRIIPLLLLAVSLSACSFGYQARGRLSDVAGEMRGKAYPGSRGGGRFVLSDPSGYLTCDGQTDPVTIFPHPGSCLGEAGSGTLQCSDGREMTLYWESTTCRAWQGRGQDAQGNQLQFRVERR